MVNHKEVQIAIIDEFTKILGNYANEEYTSAKLATAKGHLATFLAKRVAKLAGQLDKAEAKKSA